MAGIPVTSGYIGDGALATAAAIYKPSYIVLDFIGNILISDTSNMVIQKVTKSTGCISTVAGSYSAVVIGNGDGGFAISTHVDYPKAITFDNLGNIYVASSNSSSKISISEV